MKMEASNNEIRLTKLCKNKKIIHSSVNFQSTPATSAQKTRTDFLVDLEEAINSGDDTLWRMWR